VSRLTSDPRASLTSGAAFLATWSAYDWEGGLHLDACAPLDRILVRTANSTYHIVIVDPATADVIVRGGAFFPVDTRARLAGSSLGGSFLKMRSIHVGFRLEISAAVGVILTSPVRSVSVAAASASGDALM